MKALFVSNDPSLFAEGSPALSRMRAYQAAIGELWIVSRTPRAAEIHEDGLHLYGVPGGRLSALMRLSRLARRLILQEGIEVVSAQDPFEHGLVAMRAVRGTGAKLHVQVHTDFLTPWFVRSGNIRSARVRMPLLNRVRRRIADRVLPEADGVRAVSKRVADSIVGRYGSRAPAPSVIPIAVPPLPAQAVPFPEHPFTFVLFAASRLAPEKRIEDVLHALARVARTYPGLGLMIAGEGPERAKLERIAERLGLSARVRFLGWRSDVLGLLRSAHGFIQASAYEGYGMSLVEAALAGVPVITTDVGIVGEVFRGYEEVLAAPVADPAALATHVRGLIEDAQARTLLTMNAERAARAHLASAGDQPARIAEDLAAVLAKDR